MPTIDDNPTDHLGETTDDGKHIAQTIAGQDVWNLIEPDPSGTTHYVSRADGVYATVPTIEEAGVDAFVENDSVVVMLTNGATEYWEVVSGTPVLKRTIKHQRLYGIKPNEDDFVPNDVILLYGQVDPAGDGIYRLVDVSGTGAGPNTWVQESQMVQGSQ